MHGATIKITEFLFLKKVDDEHVTGTVSRHLPFTMEAVVISLTT